jgi:hypothetical protein
VILNREIKKLLYSLFVTMFLLSNGSVYSQETLKKATKQSSLEAFSKGDFESAYSQFSELSNQYSLDPLYKYFMGACLVSLQREPVKATGLLQDAIGSSTTIKTVPADAWFYLGRAMQMAGNFADAIDSFDKFTEEAGKKNARSMGVPDFIQQCSEKKGVIAETVPVGIGQVKTYGGPVSASGVIPANENNKVAVNTPEGQLIESIPADYDDKLSKALDSQYKSDSIVHIADSLKQEMNTLTWDKRIALQKRINTLDSLAVIFQTFATDKY